MADVKISEVTADAAISGTEKLLGVDGSVTKTLTVDLISDYVNDQLLGATADTVFDGADDVIVERSDSAYKVPVSAMATYVVGAAFDSTVVTSASNGDLVVLERAGETKTISVDNLKSYMQTSASDVLDFSGLDAATLGATDTLAVCQGSTALSTTLASLETKLWDDLDTHINGRTAVTTTEDSDVFHVYQGGTEKKVTASVLASYFETQNAAAVLATAWDADPVVSAVSGDELILERSDVLKTIDVDAVGDHAITRLGAKDAAVSVAAGDDFPIFRSGTPMTADVGLLTDYVLDATWDISAVTTLVAGDKLALGRSGETTPITVTNFVSQIQSDVLDYSGLGAATLGTTDQYIVVQGSTPLKTTLADIETKLWADRLTHVSGLTAVTTVADSDIFHVNQGGTSKKVTPVELAAYVKSEVESDILATAWDAGELTTAASGDMFILERSGTLATMDIDAIASFAVTTLGGSSAAESIAASDDFVFYRSGSAYLGDVDDIVTYTVGAAFDSTSGGAVASGDLFVIERSGTAYTITVDDLKTYVSDVTSLDVSGLSSATLTTTDEMLVCQSGATKKTTIADLEDQFQDDFATYVGTELGETTSIADGDKFYMLDAGSPAYTQATTLADYVSDEIWGAASTSSLNATDTILIQQAGTTKVTTLSDITEDIVGVSQATVLDISGLSSATLSTGDLIPVCQGTTAKKTTVDDLSDEAHSAFSTYVAGLSAVATTVAADKIYCIQGGVAKYVTPAELAVYHYDYVVDQLEGLDEKTTPVADDVLLLQDSENGDVLKKATIQSLADELRWKTIDPDKYTATISLVPVIFMTDTSDMEVGLPLRYSYNGSTYYGIINQVTGSSISVTGADLSMVYPLTDLAVGVPEQVEQVDFFVEWIYDDAVQDVLANVACRNYAWRKPPAKLVYFNVAHHWPDSGASQPYINMKINSTLVSSNSSGKGIQLSSSADYWLTLGTGLVDSANYSIEYGDSLEIRCTQVGTNGDADSLSVSCLFVYE